MKNQIQEILEDLRAFCKLKADVKTLEAELIAAGFTIEQLDEITKPNLIIGDINA